MFPNYGMNNQGMQGGYQQGNRQGMMNNQRRGMFGNNQFGNNQRGQNLQQRRFMPFMNNQGMQNRQQQSMQNNMPYRQPQAMPQQGMPQQSMPPQAQQMQQAPGASNYYDPSVRVEPLTEELLQQIQANGAAAIPAAGITAAPSGEALPTTAEAPTPVAVTPDAEPVSDPLRIQIESIMQNEKNASEFYAYLSKFNRNSEAVFARAEQSSRNNIELLKGIYRPRFGDEHTPEDRRINKSLSFSDSVRLAIAEETTSICDFADLYEQVRDESILKRIRALLYRKNALISRLYLYLQR